MDELIALYNGLADFGFINFLIIVFLIFESGSLILKMIDFYKNRFGFSTRASIEKEAQNSKLNEHDESIKALKDSVDTLANSLTEMRSEFEVSQKKAEEAQKRADIRERNKIRDRLLRSYRYYTNTEKNPVLAWSEMESDSFWQMFKDYEDLDGDGFMHSEVQSAMNKLIVVKMDDVKQLAYIVSQRK